MKKIIHMVFLLAGMAGFILLLDRFGISNIIHTAGQAGWSLIYVLAVWLVIYVLNTLAWRLVLGASGAKLSFPKLFAVFVSGYALNTITPFLAVGGEPYRAGMLADEMDGPSSVSAVVLYRVINLFGHMLLLATGVLYGILIVPMPAALRVLLIATLMAVGGLGYWIFTLHRDGIFIRLARWFRRFRILHRFGRALDRHASELTMMDALFTDAYHHRRRSFLLALLLEYVTRAMMGLEVCLILRGVGVPVTFGAALFVYVTYSLIINLIFFVPMNFGIRESGLMLGLQGLAITPLLGVYLGVVIRIRELFWVLLGLLFMSIATIKRFITVRETRQP